MIADHFYVIGLELGQTTASTQSFYLSLRGSITTNILDAKMYTNYSEAKEVFDKLEYGEQCSPCQVAQILSFGLWDVVEERVLQ